MDKTKLFAAVEKAVQKGQVDKALEGLEQILKYDPIDLKALNRAADLYIKESQFEKAVDCLKRVGTVYAKDGFYSKAVAIYKRILKIDQIKSKETLIGVHEQLAGLYGHLGLVSDAMGHFSVVVDFYDQAGDQPSLLEVLKKVSDLDPNNIESQLKLVELFLAQSREAEAVECLDRVTENVQTRNSLVDLVRVCERAVELFPKNTGRLQALVDVYIQANEPKKSLAKIQTAFRADPRNPVVLELLSSTFVALKQPDKSKAVDVELVKLYRQNGDLEKVETVEARIKGLPLTENPVAQKKTVRASGVTGDEPVDPVESLIKALPLSADERKILSECEVYFKYGLADKAYEVLTSRLGQFPQSLILRWKLKTSTHELKKTDETIHLLSEIILLAKSQNLEIWANLAASELQALDADHAALSGFSKKENAEPDGEKAKSVAAITRPVETKAGSSQPGEFSFKDFENSEVSIVIDDELSEESPEFSEISFQEFNTEAKAPKRAPPPEEETIELVDMASDIKPLPDRAPVAKTIDMEAVVDEAASQDEEPQTILSEADFTVDELSQLESQLAPEPAPEPKASKAGPREEETKTRKQAVIALEEAQLALSIEKSEAEAVSGLEDSSVPIDLGIAAEKEPSVMGEPNFEVRQGIEEVLFFRSQGLNDEAETLLLHLKEKFPQFKDWGDAEAKGGTNGGDKKGLKNAGKLNKKTQEVETLGRKVKLSVQEDSRDESESNFFDLANELKDEFESENPASEGPAEIKDVFNAFKQGVAAAVSEDDWQTHFDLGIAYREMQLYDDAFEEFKLVSKISQQRVSALYQMGLTKMAAQKFAEAHDLFDKALREPTVLNQEKLSLSYELAEVLLKLNNRDKAKKLFEEVKKLDPEFREVSERVKALA